MIKNFVTDMLFEVKMGYLSLKYERRRDLILIDKARRGIKFITPKYVSLVKD